MIEIDKIARLFDSRALLVQGETSLSYGEFFRMVGNNTPDVEQRPRLDVDLSWSPETLSLLVSGLVAGNNVLVNGCPEDGALDAFKEAYPLLVIPTGKRNGKRIHVVHSTATFLGDYRVEDRVSKRCLILHEAGGIEGLELFLEQLYQGGTLVLPGDMDAASVTATLNAQPIDVLSVPPSKLHALLGIWEPAGAVFSRLRELRVCGYPVTRDLWSRLQVIFPEASLHQQFGLPELGMLPVSDDPAEPGALYLEAPNHTWKVEGGQLYVWCPRRMLGTLDSGPINFSGPWYATGLSAERTPRASIRLLADGSNALPGH